eukprot:1287778-Rhodomonas_salina.1
MRKRKDLRVGVVQRMTGTGTQVGRERMRGARRTRRAGGSAVSMASKHTPSIPSQCRPRCECLRWCERG